MMRSRRVLLGGFAVMPMVGALSAMIPGEAAASGAPASAALAFIKKSGDALVAVVNGPGSKAQKATKLRELVDQIVAVGKIGRFVLGRFVRVATPAQLSAYQKLFHQLLAYRRGLNFGTRGKEKQTRQYNEKSEFGSHGNSFI